jgi:hypothetical protein
MKLSEGSSARHESGAQLTSATPPMMPCLETRPNNGSLRAPFQVIPKSLRNKLSLSAN